VPTLTANIFFVCILFNAMTLNFQNKAEPGRVDESEDAEVAGAADGGNQVSIVIKLFFDAF
jgi:hypothetical protein